MACAVQTFDSPRARRGREILIGWKCSSCGGEGRGFRPNFRGELIGTLEPGRRIPAGISRGPFGAWLGLTREIRPSFSEGME